MDTASSLAEAFNAARLEQIALHGRTVSPFDEAVGNAVLHATTLAMGDAEKGDTGKVFRVVAAPTGSGKSCSAAAAIAAGWRLSDAFTAAYITETIRGADEIGALIGALIGEDNVTVWTSAHDVGADAAEVESNYGKLLMKRRAKSDLLAARVVVVTHAAWLAEMKAGAVRGVRHCNGWPRSVIYIDEHPDLVKVIERSPGDVVKLRDRVLHAAPDHPWLPILNAIVLRAEEAFNSKGSTYARAALVEPEEGAAFSLAAQRSLTDFVDPSASEPVQSAQVADMKVTCAFIQAAGAGCAFMKRSDPGRQLLAYALEFAPGPGHVLLDATADVTGMVTLLPGMEAVPVPAVDFSALEVRHISTPEAYKFLPKVLSAAKSARPYADWIRNKVTAHTQPGERVLVVAHRALFQHEYLDAAADPDQPLDWEGRQVNTINWGAGIGSNRFRDASAVFLFGEFYAPRSKAISDAHAWTGTPLSDTALKDACGQEPRGIYLTVQEGHLVRWTKQLACRGAVRRIDPEGRCGQMRLYTSMNRDRLFKFLPVMFPGAAAPVMVRSSRPPKRGIDALCHLLATDQRNIIWSDQIETETGAQARSLRRWLDTPKVSAAADLYGWKLVTAKQLGEKGKRKALVRASTLHPITPE